ncbi:unnamed protein product [Prunus armeniaca]
MSHCLLWAWLHSHQPSNCPLWVWLHSHQPAHNHISLHTSGRTRPRMGSVNTPATPTTRATSTQYNNSPYDRTHPATYGVCQHAGYSYDMCDLRFGPGYILTSPHTIISPFIRRDAPGHVRGLSTRRLLLRHVRPHNNHNITPHMTGRTRPCMESVNTPATPMTRATSQQSQYHPSYDGTHPTSYRVCQHAGYSYDTCDLTSISHCPLWAWLHSHQPARV